MHKRYLRVGFPNHSDFERFSFTLAALTGPGKVPSGINLTGINSIENEFGNILDPRASILDIPRHSLYSHHDELVTP